MAEFSQKPEFCLDTNILIQMKSLVVKDVAEIKTMNKNDVTNSIYQILDKIQNGKIKAVITPTTLKEVLQGVSFYGYNLVDFIRDNEFYVYEVAREEKKHFHDCVNKLSFAYCDIINNNDIKRINQMFNNRQAASYARSVFPVKKISKDKIVPTNDARVMAQSTFMGLPLITNDTKDFIYDNRPDIISYINKKYHYKTACRPYTSKDALEYIKDRKVFTKMSPVHEKNLTDSCDCEYLL